MCLFSQLRLHRGNGPGAQRKKHRFQAQDSSIRFGAIKVLTIRWADRYNLRIRYRELSIDRREEDR